MDRYLNSSFRFVPIFIAMLMILGPMTGMIGYSDDFSELSNEENWESPPGIGSTNSSIQNLTWLNGSHAYDNLYVGCSNTTASCGGILAVGDLILTVNTLTVDVGGFILAVDYNQSQGMGSDTTLSSSWRGSGAGGGGHYANGGSGGGSSGNGGSSYGCLLYTYQSPRDAPQSRMTSSA